MDKDATVVSSVTMCGEELSKFSQQHFDTSEGASSMEEQQWNNSFEPSVAEETSSDRGSSYGNNNEQENGGDSECVNVAELSPARSSVAEDPQVGQVSTTTESPLNLPVVSEDEQKSVSSELHDEEAVTETHETFSPSSNIVASKTDAMDIDVVGPTTTTDVVTESTPSQSSITDNSSCSDSEVLNSAHQDVTEYNPVVQLCDSDTVLPSIRLLCSDEVPSSSTNENHLNARTSEPTQSVTINHSTDKAGDIIDTTAAVNKQHQTEPVAMEDDSVADSDVSWASLEVHASKSLAVSSVSDALSGDEVVTSPRGNDIKELPPDSLPSTETVTTLADSMEDKMLSPQKSPSPVAITVHVDSTTGSLGQEEIQREISNTDTKTESLIADDGTSMESQQEDNVNERIDEQQMAVQSSSEEAIAVRPVENEVLPEDPHVLIISRQLPEDSAVPEQSSTAAVSVVSESHEPADEGIPLESKEDITKNDVGTSEDLSEASCQDADEALHEDTEELMDTSLETTTESRDPVSASHEQVTTSHELTAGTHSHEHMVDTEAAAVEPMDVSYDQSSGSHEPESVEGARTLIQSSEDNSAMVTSCSDQPPDVAVQPHEHTSGSPDTTGLLQEEDNCGTHDNVSVSSNVLHPMSPQNKDEAVTECSGPPVIPTRVGLVDYPGSPSDNCDESNTSDDGDKDDKMDPEPLAAPPSPTPSNASTPSSASLSSLDELPPSPGTIADNSEIPQPQAEVSELLSSQSDNQVVEPPATLPEVSRSPDALVVSPKAIVESPVAQPALSEMETEPCDVETILPDHLTESSKPQVGSPEPQVTSPEVQTRSPEPPARSPELQARSPEPPARSPEPPARSPEPPARSPEPPARSPELQAKSPEPQTRSPEPQARSPEPQMKSPELQVRSPELHMEPQQTISSEPKVQSPCQSPEAQMELSEAQLATELSARSPEMKVGSVGIQMESDYPQITDEPHITSSDEPVRSPEKHIALPEAQIAPSETQSVEALVISPEPQTTSTEMQTGSPVSKVTPTELQARSPDMESTEIQGGLPGQHSEACELHVTSPDPHITSSEPMAVSPEQQSGLSKVYNKSSELHDKQSPQQIMSSELQVRSPEMQVGSPEMQVRSPEMQVASPEPQVISPEMPVASSELQERSPEMQVASPEPQVRSPEMPVASSELQERSPESQQIKSPEPQVQSSEMELSEPQVESPEHHRSSEGELPEQQSEMSELHTMSPKQQVISSEMQVESPEPQVRPSESQYELSEPPENESPARSPEMQVESHEPQVESCKSQYQPSEPQQTKSSEPQTRSLEPQAKSSEPQIRSPELQVRSPEPQTRSPEPQTRSPENQTRSPEPQTRSPEPQVKSPEPQTRSPEPQVRAPEPQTRSPEPQVRAPEPQTRSPGVQARSPENQTEEMQIDSPEPQVTATEQPEPSSAVEVEPTEIQEAKSPRLQLPLHDTPTTLSATSPRQAASGLTERPHSPSSPGSLVVEIGSPKVSIGVLSESAHKIPVDNIEEQTSTMMQTDQQLTEGRGPDVTLHDISYPVSFDAGIKERHGSTVSDTSEQHCHSEGSLHLLTATGEEDAVMTSELPAEQLHGADSSLAAVDTTSPVKVSSDTAVGQEQEVSLVTESDLVCREDERTMSEQNEMPEMLPDQIYEQTPLEPIAEEDMDASSSDHQQDIENNDNQVVTQSESLEDAPTKEKSKDDLLSVSQDLETCEPTSKDLSLSIGQVDSKLPSSEIDLQGDENISQVCEMDTDQTVETGGVNATQQIEPNLQDEQVTELSNEKPEINKYLPEDVTSVTSPVPGVDVMDEEVSPSSKSVSSIDSDFEDNLTHIGLLGPLATSIVTTTAVSDDTSTGVEEREVEKGVTEVEREAELEEESHPKVMYHSEMEQVDKADAETTATPLVEDSTVSATTQAAVTELAETVQEETKSSVDEVYKDKSENEAVLLTESAEPTSNVVTASTETAGDVICKTAIDQEPRVSTGDEEAGETATNKDIHETASEREPPEVVNDIGQHEAVGDTVVTEKDPPEIVSDRMSDNEVEASMDTNETSGGSHDNTAESYTALVYLQQQVPVSCDESTKSSSDLKESSVSLELTQSLDDVNVTLDQDNQMTEKIDNMSTIPDLHVPISASQQSLSSVTEGTSGTEVTAPVGVVQEILVSSNDSLITTDKVVTTSTDNETTSSATEELQVDVEGVTDDSMESAREVPEPSAGGGGGESDDSGDSSDSSSSDSDSDDNQTTTSSSSHEDQMEATIVTGVDIPSEAGRPDAAQDDAVTIVESGTVKIVDPITNTGDVEKKQQEDDMEISEAVKPVLEVTSQETNQQETVADSLPQTTPVPLQEATARETEDTAAKPVRKLRPRPIPADASQTWESLTPESKQLHTKSRSKHSEQEDVNNVPTTNVQVASGQVMSVGAYMEQYKNQHPQEFSSSLLQRCGVIIPQVAQHDGVSKEEGLQRASPAYSKNSQVVSTTSMPITSSIPVTMGNYAIVGDPKRQSVSEHSHDSSAAGGVEQMRVSNLAERSGPRSLQQLLTGEGRTSSPHDVSAGATADSPSYKGLVKDKVHFYIAMHVCVCECLCVLVCGICMYIYN